MGTPSGSGDRVLAGGEGGLAAVEEQASSEAVVVRVRRRESRSLAPLRRAFPTEPLDCRVRERGEFPIISVPATDQGGLVAWALAISGGAGRGVVLVVVVVILVVVDEADGSRAHSGPCTYVHRGGTAERQQQQHSRTTRDGVRRVRRGGVPQAERVYGPIAQTDGRRVWLYQNGGLGLCFWAGHQHDMTSMVGDCARYEAEKIKYQHGCGRKGLPNSQFPYPRGVECGNRAESIARSR